MVFISGDSLNGDSVCIVINIADDDVYEGSEELLIGIMAVSPPSAAVIGAVSNAVKQIQDNEGQCLVLPINNKLSWL